MSKLSPTTLFTYQDIFIWFVAVSNTGFESRIVFESGTVPVAVVIVMESEAVVEPAALVAVTV
jgi:hypothetical protein